MADPGSIAGRSAADSQVLRSALMSSSYACYRNKQKPIPVRVPAYAYAAMPSPISQMATSVADASDHPAYGYVVRAVERELRVTKDPAYDEFLRYCQYAREEPTEEKELTHVELAFDPDLTTTATVYSSFPDVPKKSAERMMATLALPWKWHEAAPTFFKKTDVINGSLDDAGLERAFQARQKVQILEHVEWNWRPGVEGGIINILDVRSLEEEDDEAWQAEVAEKTGYERTVKGSRATGSTGLSLKYRYDLNQCLQTRFLGSWEVGGLDKDDGKYRAAWIPTGDSTGDYLLKLTKVFRYAKNWTALPDVPTIFNFFAPAVVSLLMKQIGFEGIRDDLYRVVPPPVANKVDREKTAPPTRGS